MLFLLGDAGQSKNLMMTNNGQEWMVAAIPLALQGILPVASAGALVLIDTQSMLYWMDLKKAGGSPQPMQALPRNWRSVAIAGVSAMVITGPDNSTYYSPDIRQKPLQQIFQHTWVVNAMEKVQAFANGSSFLVLGSFYDRVSKQYFGAIVFDPARNQWLGAQATAGFQECLFYDEKGGLAGCRENLSPRAPVVFVSTRNNQPLSKLPATRIYFQVSNQTHNHLLILEHANQMLSWVSRDSGRTWDEADASIVGFPVSGATYDPASRIFFLGNAYRFAVLTETFRAFAGMPEAFSPEFQLAGGQYNTAVL